jgi:hypothetical protein
MVAIYVVYVQLAAVYGNKPALLTVVFLMLG